MKNQYQPLYHLLFLLYLTPIYTQSSKNVNKTYEAYDAFVGYENMGLYNGPEFRNEFPNAQGESRFLGYFAFLKGTVTYKDQKYYQVPLEYDIFTDNVITRSNDHLNSFIVQLVPEFISEFEIDTHRFVKLTDPKLDLGGNGFYEVLVSGDTFRLYVKHIRDVKERIMDFAIKHSFTNKNYHLVKYDGTYHIINSIRDFKELIPERYKEVQKFRKDYKSLYKADLDDFMIKLIGHLDGY